MNLKQISIFLENKQGRLAEVTGILARGGINIRALALADTTDFGVLRIIVDDPDKCLAILKDNELVAQVTPVLAVEVPDRPGGLDSILKVFEQHNLNVEYMYATVEKNQDNAIVIFKVADPAGAVGLLQQQGLALVSAQAIRNMM